MSILTLPQARKKITVTIRIGACLGTLLLSQVRAFAKDITIDQADLTERINTNNQLDKRKFYLDLASREAEKYHLPADIADAVMAIESGYDPDAVGTVGEIGLMQVRPETASLLGFNGQIEDLSKPETNIHYGVKYLSEAWHLANGDLCRALMKYRAGHGEENMSALSADYCKRARAHLASIGSPFSAGIAPTIGELGGMEHERPNNILGKHGPQIRTLATSRAFWAAEQRRVKAITARIERKWHRLAAR